MTHVFLTMTIFQEQELR